MQGTVYRAKTAYSYWGASTTTGTCTAINLLRVATRTNESDEEADGSRTRKASRVRASRSPGAELQYDSYGHSHLEDRDVYSGEATIVMGIITAMAGQKKEKWDEGVFEYVVYFSAGTTVTTGLDASIPWIRDKTYKLTFYKHSNKY